MDQHAKAMFQSSRRVVFVITGLLIIYSLVLAANILPSHLPKHAHSTTSAHTETTEHLSRPSASGEARYLPPYWAVAPFAALLLSIALLPLFPTTKHWWHQNRNRFLVTGSLGILTLAYYGLLHPGGLANHFTHAAASAPALDTIFTVFGNAIFAEFIPFIVLLFSLYVISGGINLQGDLPAHPMTNCAFIGIGTALASFIGTTGAAMILIRPLLSTNAERKYKVHTVLFFIFMVCNCGGLLLPIGDPPLFLGYLRGVPFTWTLRLLPYWLVVNSVLLVIYYGWDSWVYRKEALKDILRDETQILPLALIGKINFLLILGVVLSVALIVPDKPFLGTHLEPPVFLREALMMLLVVLSLLLTAPQARVGTRFNYSAIIEVTALFSGIFICMQVPIEILNVKGSSLGINSPVEFFWATGILSSFLDNAPTYVVFFETATTLSSTAANTQLYLPDGRTIWESSLVAISLGAVFMGANTYIGNGPNFMVKSIAEQAGIKMPSFFGYMAYSGAILLPLFAILTFFL